MGIDLQIIASFFMLRSALSKRSPKRLYCDTTALAFMYDSTKKRKLSSSFFLVIPHCFVLIIYAGNSSWALCNMTSASMFLRTRFLFILTMKFCVRCSNIYRVLLNRDETVSNKPTSQNAWCDSKTTTWTKQTGDKIWKFETFKWKPNIYTKMAAWQGNQTT